MSRIANSEQKEDDDGVTARGPTIRYSLLAIRFTPSITNISSSRKIAVSRSHLSLLMPINPSRERKNEQTPSHLAPSDHFRSGHCRAPRRNVAGHHHRLRPSDVSHRPDRHHAGAREGFGDLVEKVMPAVVSVEAKLGVRTPSNIQGDDDDEGRTAARNSRCRTCRRTARSVSSSSSSRGAASVASLSSSGARGAAARLRARASSSPMTAMSSPTTMW